MSYSRYHRTILRFGARQLEAEAISSRLKGLGLRIHEIPSDGDCLYAAIAHQLSTVKGGGGGGGVAGLRSLTSAELRAHPADYLPFLTDPKTGDMMTGAGFEDYCRELESSPVWGGQVEVMALSKALRVPLVVVQAEGPNVEVGTEEFNKEEK